MAAARNLKAPDLLVLPYYIAFLKGDKAGMDRAKREAAFKALEDMLREQQRKKQDDLERLKKENEDLKKENDILKDTNDILLDTLANKGTCTPKKGPKTPPKMSPKSPPKTPKKPSGWENWTIEDIHQIN